METANNKENTKKFSKETSLCIEALEHLLKVEECMLLAYMEVLGDPEGEKIFRVSKQKEDLDRVKNWIKSEIADHIEINMGKRNNQVL